MEAAGSYTNSSSKDDRHDHDDEDVPLPGFRFHPTDEELVGFYLRRKIQNKPISLELIKSIDIYKHDPWDLPKAMSAAGADKEWYFFCRRGRKYKNSIRPNRVTGSGFWKATGIDKPVHDSRNINCIGLKKTLVYYRGSAGKGTKTDWMMHEFRLPLVNDANNVHTNHTSCTASSVNNTVPSSVNNTVPPEAEIWTLCRIFKRSVSHRKYTPDWRELSTKHSKKCGTTNFYQDRQYPDSPANQEAHYIDFGASAICYEEKKPQVLDYTNYSNNGISKNIQSTMLQNNVGQLSSAGMATNTTHPYTMESFSSNFDIDSHDFFNEDWDEIRSIVQLALDPTFL